MPSPLHSGKVSGMRPLMNFYAFDIDGTLADHRHRLHYVAGVTKDWDAFERAASDDMPIANMVALAKSIGADHGIVYVTGRRERQRGQTEKWLRLNGLPDGELYMRDATASPGTDVTKLAILRRVLDDGIIPTVAFDDRGEVVRAWQAAGINCCLVCIAHHVDRRDEPTIVRLGKGRRQSANRTHW